MATEEKTTKPARKNSIIYVMLAIVILAAIVTAWIYINDWIEDMPIDFCMPIYIEFPYLQYQYPVLESNLTATEIKLHLYGHWNRVHEA